MLYWKISTNLGILLSQMSKTIVKDPFKKFRINISPREDIEPEEIFFDSAKLKQFDEEAVEAEKIEKPIPPLVFLLFEILQIAVIVFVGSYSAYIVIAKGNGYIIDAQDNSSRASLVFAERGLIYSSDGIILAHNETYFDLFIKSAKLEKSMIDGKDFLELSNSLASALNEDADAMRKKFSDAESKSFSEYAVARGVSKEEIKKIESIIIKYSFFEINEVSRRGYHPDFSFSHILGYTGELTASDLLFKEYSRGERIGKAGVEAFYDDALRGEPGILIKEIDSTGNVLGQELSKEPRRGVDITLHINERLQGRVHEILKRHARALEVDHAVAVLLDPRDGSVVSIVNIPGFDSNLFEQGITQSEFEKLISDPRKPLFNRAVGGEYPSGSIIKPIIAAAALEEGLVTPEFLVYSDGAIEVPSVYNSDVVYEFKDWKAHGWTDMRKAIADSVNIYFYTIGGGYKGQEGLGIRNIEKYLKEFNWGARTGIDLPGEQRGLIPTPKWKKETKGENWYIGDTYLTSIGQGDILVTPIQIAASTAVFANKGTFFSPKVVSMAGEEQIESKIINKDFTDQKNIEVVREGMRRAVESGSSVFLADLPYEIAGKTGTAQTGRVRNHAWFTGFAPYDDAEIVVTVLLEEGEKSDYAVRAAKEIFEAYFDVYPQG